MQENKQKKLKNHIAKLEFLDKKNRVAKLKFLL